MATTKYHCCLCDKAGELHEVFFGNGIRKLAIDYRLQIPVCDEHHREAHTLTDFYQVCFCDLMGINFRACYKAIGMSKYSPVRQRYLERVKEYLKHFLRQYEV